MSVEKVMRLMRLTGAAMILTACSNQVDKNLDVELVGVPNGASDAQYKKAKGILGRQESAVVFKIKAPLKGEVVVSYYQPKLEQAGWRPCTGSTMHGKWGSFIDATRKESKEKEMVQYVGYFTRNNDFAKLLIEQPLHDLDNAQSRETEQVTILLFTGGSGEKCPA